MTRAALYARVSHDRGDQDPEAQLLELRSYATARGWEIAGEYVDRAPASTGQVRAASGQFTGRPEWARLWNDCRRRKVDLVLVWKLDRAFRSAHQALDWLSAFKAYRVEFVCATQPIDTSSSLGRFVFTTLAAVAEMERDLISERTRAGHARARAEGKHIGRPKGRKDSKRRARRNSRRLLRPEDFLEAAG